MLFNLLDSTTSSGTTTTDNGIGTWIMLGVFAVLMIVFMVFNRRSQKKREEEAKQLLDSVKPGLKVKTIGGICGTIVEVCKDDNTFILETGSKKSGKSYLKFDKYAIAQMDKDEVKTEAPKTEEVKEEPFEETKQED